jgi:hypothetical protein
MPQAFSGKPGLDSHKVASHLLTQLPNFRVLLSICPDLRSVPLCRIDPVNRRLRKAHERNAGVSPI